MNRIEERMNALKSKGEKAFITYVTAGLPSLKDTISIIKAQDEAGVDVIELGVPFSDPIADGPVIQAASLEAINNGTNIDKIFEMMKELRKDCQVPVVFMLYYNTVNHFGIKRFVETCAECGVDGIIVPDLPYEESFELREFLDLPGAPFLLPLIAPISGDRIPMLLENARGFAYCISSMGVTGQDANEFYRNTTAYLDNVRKISQIPVMMGFGIKEFKDVESYIDHVDGCIVGTHLINIMRETNYSLDAIKDYVSGFKKALNPAK